MDILLVELTVWKCITKNKTAVIIYLISKYHIGTDASNEYNKLWKVQSNSY